jgi:hypothetical protein
MTGSQTLETRAEPDRPRGNATRKATAFEPVRNFVLFNQNEYDRFLNPQVPRMRLDHER